MSAVEPSENIEIHYNVKLMMSELPCLKIRFVSLSALARSHGEGQACIPAYLFLWGGWVAKENWHDTAKLRSKLELFGGTPSNARFLFGDNGHQ